MVREAPEDAFQPAESNGGSKMRLMKAWTDLIHKSGMFNVATLRDKAQLLRFVILFVTHPMPIDNQSKYRQHGLFEFGSLVNNSCDPCLQPVPGYMRDDDDGTFTPIGQRQRQPGESNYVLWTSLRDLRPGDVLTFAYTGSRASQEPADYSCQFPSHALNPSVNRSAFNRRLELFNTYGFVCSCQRCLKESTQDGCSWWHTYNLMFNAHQRKKDAQFSISIGEIKWNDFIEWYEKHPRLDVISPDVDRILREASCGDINDLVHDPLALSQSCCALGSRFFKVERYDRALIRYKQAKCFLPSALASGDAGPNHGAQQEQVVGARECFRRCCANIALCSLRLAEYEDCKLACDEFLNVSAFSKGCELLQDNVLYHKAKALAALGENVEALEALGRIATEGDAEVIALKKAILEKFDPASRVEQDLEVADAQNSANSSRAGLSKKAKQRARQKARKAAEQ